LTTDLPSAWTSAQLLEALLPQLFAGQPSTLRLCRLCRLLHLGGLSRRRRLTRNITRLHTADIWLLSAWSCSASHAGQGLLRTEAAGWVGHS
jgi:hypothetical protein